MADEETKAEEKPKRKKLIPILLGVNVLLIAGVAAYFVLGNPGAPARSAEAQAPAAPQEGFGPLVEMFPLVANLNEPDSGRYIKVVMHVEANDATAATAIEEAMIPIRDRMLVFFTDIEVEDTRGAEKKNELRAQLLTIINETVGSPQARNVYFSEFVIQ